MRWLRVAVPAMAAVLMAALGGTETASAAGAAGVLGVQDGAGATAAPAEVVCALALRTPYLSAVEFGLPAVQGISAGRIRVELRHEAGGAVRLSGFWNGAPVACAGSVRSTPAGVSYRLVVRERAGAGFTVVLSGHSRTPVASVTLRGPGVRWRGESVPVELDLVNPVSAQVRLAPVVDESNALRGAAWLEADYGGADLTAPGTVRGRVTAESLVWVARQGTRSASFRGRRVGDNYVGTLRVTLRPAVETVTNVTVAAAELPLRSGRARLRGVVLDADTAEPLAGVEVTARSLDAAASGGSAGRLSGRDVTDELGRYDLDVPVVTGVPLALAAVVPGAVSGVARLDGVVPGADLFWTLAVERMAFGPVHAGAIASGDAAWTLSGMPGTVRTAGVRLWRPLREPGVFGGDWRGDGNTLLSPLVAGWLEARNAGGASVGAWAGAGIGGGGGGGGDGGSGAGNATAGVATLLVRAPRESWPGWFDARPGTDRIEVPVYAWDPVAGGWQRERWPGTEPGQTGASVEAVLVSASGMPWPETELEAIRSGAWPGEVWVAVPRGRGGGWCVGGNSDDAGWEERRFSGRLAEGDGRPLVGAVVSLRGADPSVRQSRAITGVDGAFTLRVGWSRTTRDGTSVMPADGVTAGLSVRIGATHHAPDLVLSPDAGSPGAGINVDLGEIRLGPGSRRDVTWREWSGRAVYGGCVSGDPPRMEPGAGVSRATVTVVDVEAWAALWDSLGSGSGSGSGSGRAALADSGAGVVTGGSGEFVVRYPSLWGGVVRVRAEASAGGTYGLYEGLGWRGDEAGGDDVAVDYAGLGYFAASVTDAAGGWRGVMSMVDGVLSLYLSTGEGVRVGELPGMDVPSRVGDWVDVPLRLGSASGVPAGFVRLRVSRLNPAAGTWEWQEEPAPGAIFGLGVSVGAGVWEQSTPAP